MSDESRLGPESASAEGGGAVRLVALTKRVDDVLAVAGIDLDIAAGEFFSLLGPSGCGKTTTLRLIAGFEPPTSGAILLDGKDLSRTPPHLRNVNMVFQSYALFPHMNVYDNIAYGLRWRKVSRAETRSRVAEALELVQLQAQATRRPGQLSGGEQQRVALARALVLRPAVLLLDEPLGSLDAKLRKALQVELKALQEQLGITFVFVTHDQEEALSMSDRIAVMRDGQIEQVGTPRVLYEEPATIFVADFLGISNMAAAVLESSDGGGCWLRIGAFRVRATQGSGLPAGVATIVVRPERVHLEPYDSAGGGNRVPGIVERTVYLGASVLVIVRIAGGATLQVSVPNSASAWDYGHGMPVHVYLPPDAVRVVGVEATASGAERREPAPTNGTVEVLA